MPRAIFTALVAGAVWSSTPAAEDGDTGEGRVGMLERQVQALQAQVEHLSEIVGLHASSAVRRDAHIAHLLSLLAQGQQASNGTQCPFGSMATTTSTNPPYRICVQIQPHMADSTLTTDGHWAGCEDVRNWALLAHSWLKTYLAGQGHLQTKFGRLRLVFVDIGAHIGMCSIYMAMFGSSTWRNSGPWPANFPDVLQELPLFDVIAVEPDPVHVEMIRASAEMNGVSNLVQVADGAAWNASGLRVEFRRFELLHSAGSYVPPANGGVFDGPPAGGRQTEEVLLADTFKKRVLRVPTISVDDLLLTTVREKAQLLIMKLDIEGQEMHALQGAQGLFDTNQVLLVHFEFAATIRRDGATGADLLHFFLNNRFKLLCFGECAERVPAFRENWVGSEDIDEFMSVVLQMDYAFDMVALHHSLSGGSVGAHLTTFLPSVLQGLSHAFTSRQVIRNENIS